VYVTHGRLGGSSTAPSARMRQSLAVLPRRRIRPA
jgi:hypothetical protein